MGALEVALEFAWPVPHPLSDATGVADGGWARHI